MFVALGLWYKTRMGHYHVWPGQLCCIFSHYLIDGKIFEKKNIEYEICFDFLYHFRLKYFFF